MKLVMTIVARNEADVLDAQIAFHLHAGVDYVLVTDHGSDDGTSEILERYARAGYLHVFREDGDLRQAEWVTKMARLAATDFGADWVINSDADEFWWPRGGSLREILALVPSRFGVVRGCWRHFLPRPVGDPNFAERMTVRLCRPAFPGDKSSVYHAHQKVAHRADPEVEIERGNHNATGRDLYPFRGWHPIEVLHFSLRTVEQVARKGRDGWPGMPEEEHTEHLSRIRAAQRAGRMESFFDRIVVTDDELERGLATGEYGIDTRLRAALRTLRDECGAYVPPRAGARLEFPAPGLEDTAAYAAEASELVAIDGILRAERRVAMLEARVAALHRLPRR